MNISFKLVGWVLQAWSRFLDQLPTTAVVFFSSWCGCHLGSAGLSIDQSNAKAFLKWEIHIQESIPFSFIAYELFKGTWWRPFYLGWRQSFKRCLFQYAQISWLQFLGHLIFIQRQLAVISFRSKLKMSFINSVKLYNNVT